MERMNMHEFVSLGKGLTSRLIGVSLLSLLTGFFIFLAEQLIIRKMRIPELAGIIMPALAGVLVLAVIIFVLSRIRLAPVYRIINGDSCRERRSLTFMRLVKWPYELLLGTIAAGVLFSVLYHIFVSAPDGVELLGNVAGEQSLSLTISMVLFTGLRRALHPIVASLKSDIGELALPSSGAQPLLIIYAGTFLATLLGVFEIAVAGGQARGFIDPYRFVWAGLLHFATGISLFAYIALQYRRELVGAHSRHSQDVISAGTEERCKSDQEYDSFERELKLAYHVQQKLLPSEDLTIGAFRIVARCQPNHGVGGDFFDVLSLGPNRFAIMIGDVTGKGVPAALIMSALLLLFRAEVRRCNGPAETLDRLNKQLCEAMGEDGTVSIGVGVIDIATGEVQYASAGQLSPYIITSEGQVLTVECSSLPLGMDPEIEYSQTGFTLRPKDRMLLYTDGLIEAADSDGAMYSFDGLETELRNWKKGGSLPDMVDEWLNRMDRHYSSGHDDRTVVVLELTSHFRKQDSSGDLARLQPNQFFTKEWLLCSVLGDERDIVFELGDWIEEIWPEVSLSLKNDIQSATAEAVVNAIEHGNKLEPAARVSVVAQVASRLMVLKVYDEGGGYFPHVSRDEAEMQKKRESDDPRGWGLVLIDSLADYWSIGHDERGFYTEIYFMRKPNMGDEI